jgi:hypothetical protein
MTTTRGCKRRVAPESKGRPNEGADIVSGIRRVENRSDIKENDAWKTGQ